jgi:hypothetical protein
MRTLDLAFNVKVTFYDTGAVNVNGLRFGESTLVARFFKNLAFNQNRAKFVEFQNGREAGMNKQAVAGGLLRLAKALLAYGGQHVEVRSLPRGIQNALKHIPYNRRDIEVEEASSYAPGGSSTVFEGNRGFLMVVDIATGRIDESMQGSWGGANPFESRPLDVDKNTYPIKSGSVVVRGESGGRGTFARILVSPADKGLLIADIGPAAILTDEEKKALAAISGTKSGYRADEFRRQKLGEYDTSNSLIRSLEEKGLLQFLASGIRVTTSGKNIARQLRGW